MVAQRSIVPRAILHKGSIRPLSPQFLTTTSTLIPMDSTCFDPQITLPSITLQTKDKSIQTQQNRLIQVYCAPNSTDLAQIHMGCAPSRPSRSFYQEFFVERPLAIELKKEIRRAQEMKSIAKPATAHKHSRSDASDAPFMTYVTKIETQPPTSHVAETEMPEEDNNDLEVHTEAPITVNSTGMTAFEEEVARGDLKIYQEEVEARRIEEGKRYYLAHRKLDPNGEYVF